MPHSKTGRKKSPKRLLALPDLASSSDGTARSRASRSTERVVLRCRIHLEQRHLAPATINLSLAAVRRIAYEAADAGLLSPELAAGIRCVKGLRRIGVGLGAELRCKRPGQSPSNHLATESNDAPGDC